MSSFIGSSKEQDLILNIGSGSVYGAVVEFQKSAHPVILHTKESRFPIKPGVTAEGLLAHMIAALQTVVSELEKDHKKSIRVVHVVFVSPWFSSFSKSLSIKKPAPFVVTQKTIEKLVSEQLDTVSTAANAAQVTVIERALPNIRLNGYETSKPYGKSAKTVDVSVYSSTSPTELNKKIESEIYTVIHPKSVAFHTFPFVAWNVIRSIFSPKDDFVFIDIGHEVSDVLVVRQGFIHLIASFPMGRNHLIRKTALYFETKPELAASIINLYANDAAEPDVKEKVKTLISAFSEEWGIGFSNAVREVKGAEDYFIPQKAFFASSSNTATIFSDIISKQIPNTTPLTRENLSQFVGFGNNESPSVFSILETIYLSSHTK